MPPNPSAFKTNNGPLLKRKWTIVELRMVHCLNMYGLLCPTLRVTYSRKSQQIALPRSTLALQIRPSAQPLQRVGGATRG